MMNVIKMNLLFLKMCNKMLKISCVIHSQFQEEKMILNKIAKTLIKLSAKLVVQVILDPL